MTEVVAALICHENRFLICQRPVNKARGLLWEFVGGKKEYGESDAEALVRECQEELGITVEVGELYRKHTHGYSDITIELTLYKAKIIKGTPQLLEHNDLRWITVEEIPNYDFCPADEEILQNLMKVGLNG